MEFKELEIKEESSWFRRTFQSRHARKSIIYIVAGAVIGFLYFYFGEGKHMDVIPIGDIVKSILIGGFFGFFITNSPCARGRC